ncbi:MAG: methyltransferase domain-containing protein [Planctomycetota bacterium]|nr:methyltransferase domain-containing protein [Planctomycetota bacterium]
MSNDLRQRLEGASGFEIPDHRWKQLHEKCLEASNFTEQLALTAVPKTDWFRNAPWYQALETEFCSHLKTQAKPWACWSAGCSTGEECYSLALILHRFLHPKNGQLEILGTDFIESRLNFAREGKYSAPKSESPLHSYRPSFESSESSWQIKELPCKPQFQRHNLASEAFPKPTKGLWDLILCRNVLIYLSKEKQRELLRQFHSLLAPEGWLMTGASETLLEHQDLFQVRFCGEAFYFQKR